MTNETQNYIAQWENTASQALAVNARATASKDEKAKVFNDLAWQSLVILINGKVQDEVSLAKAVSKEGKFFALRQCVSNARPLALTVKEKGFVAVPEGRGKKKTEKSFTKDEILNSEIPAFTVSSAYRNILKNQETPEVIETEFSDNDAIALYSEQEGIDVKTINSSPSMREHAITQGRIMYADMQHKEVLQAIPVLVHETVVNFAKILNSGELVTANNLISTLRDMLDVAENRKEETELQNVA